MLRSLARGISLVVLVSAIFNRPPLAARAAPLAGPIFTVNSNSDVHGYVNNGRCQTDQFNNLCTLRAAVEAANQLTNGGATIILPALPSGGVYALSLGGLNATRSMTITGGGAAGTIIDGSQIDRVLSVVGTMQMAGVTVQNGQVAGDFGGGIIVNYYATLNLSDSVITHNVAAATTYHAGGGGIANFGTLYLANSIVSGNEVLGPLTASVAALGGGIYSAGLMTLISDNISANFAIVRSGGNEVDGGGIYARRDLNEPGIPNILQGTTFAGNLASHDGGGIYNSGAGFDSPLVLINSTISNNAAGHSGGGILNWDPSAAGSQLFNATIFSNIAQAGPSGTGGGIENSVGAKLKFENSLLSYNRLGTGGFIPSDCDGTLTSLGHNLVSSTAGCTISGTSNGNLLQQFAHLHPLANNGGPTPTLALYPDSPGVDGGDPGGCNDHLGVPLLTDQRGAPRTANGAGATICDIGAYELQRTVDLPLVRK